MSAGGGQNRSSQQTGKWRRRSDKAWKESKSHLSITKRDEENRKQVLQFLGVCRKQLKQAEPS